jgi:hypothetical protein
MTIKEFIKTAYNLCHNNREWLKNNAKPLVKNWSKNLKHRYDAYSTGSGSCT